jgi:hypothetical protein
VSCAKQCSAVKALQQSNLGAQYIPSCTNSVQSITTKLTLKLGGTVRHVSLELYACITLYPVTKVQPYLLYTEGLGPTGAPVIADSSLPDALALLLMSATTASNAHH